MENILSNSILYKGWNMIIFYERVSTERQSLARQDELLKKLNIEKVYADKATGKHMDRPQLKAMLEFAREGDTIVVESFSRLSRSTKDLLHLVESMHASIDKFLFEELYKEYKKRNITQKYMCKRLGISRSTLYKEIKRYELDNRQIHR